MFFIPSKQIPSLFNKDIVTEDFKLICKRASSILNISEELLFNTFTQAAEDELNERFDSQLTISSKERKRKKLSLCSSENCNKIGSINLENKLYCKLHYNNIQEDIVSSKFKQISINTSFIFDIPKSIHDEENQSFWTFCSFKYKNKEGEELSYKINKITGLVLDIIPLSDNIEIKLIGLYQNGTFLEKNKLPEHIIEWCIKSNILC